MSGGPALVAMMRPPTCGIATIRPASASCLLDAHRIHLIHKVPSEDTITVTQQILWRTLPWKRFTHLLGRLLRSWMCRDREMNDAPPIVC